MEDNNEKLVNDETMTTEIAENSSNPSEETASKENGEQGEQSANQEIPKEEKPKLTFDEKVDKTAGFVKKNKIALLCGIVAVFALVIGLFVGSFFGGNDETEEASSYQAEVSTEDDENESVVSTTSPAATTAATTAPTTAPTTSSEGSAATSSEVVSEPESEEAVVVTYADLLDNKIYFSESSDLSLVESDVIELLNNVLLASDETVTADGLEADGKAEMADSVNVSVTKDEMKALLDDLGATFTSIDQSVSGDILTLSVDMDMEVPAEVISEVQSNSNIFISMLISSFTTDMTFSYQVSYQMDGEALIPIEVTTSTIQINGYNYSNTELIAGIALSSYSSADVDTSTLLAGYNSMAGEIIADILNNYGVVTGATSSEINITTRTND
ncbi:MAG: hypothetical protein R3Y45_05570 [Bacillota bacterium]